MVGEAYQTCLVCLAYGYVGEHQRGVDGIVEERHAVERLLHGASLVDDRHYLLRSLVLVYIDHELMAAC